VTVDYVSCVVGCVD